VTIYRLITRCVCVCVTLGVCDAGPYQVCVCGSCSLVKAVLDDVRCDSGTIEEKIYHRQIFKHLLSKRILTDPRQSQMLSAKNLRDLFTLTEQSEGGWACGVGACIDVHLCSCVCVCVGGGGWGCMPVCASGGGGMGEQSAGVEGDPGSAARHQSHAKW
jgi:hypothetical protein